MCNRAHDETVCGGKQDALTMINNPALLGAPVSLFHTAADVAYADLYIDRHHETWPVRGKQLQAWLRRCYYKHTGAALPAGTIRSVLDLLEAHAQFDGPERTIHIRVAEHQGRIYLDLADKEWRAV